MGAAQTAEEGGRHTVCGWMTNLRPRERERERENIHGIHYSGKMAPSCAVARTRSVHARTTPPTHPPGPPQPRGWPSLQSTCDFDFHDQKNCVRRSHIFCPKQPLCPAIRANVIPPQRHTSQLASPTAATPRQRQRAAMPVRALTVSEPLSWSVLVGPGASLDRQRAGCW